MQWRRKWRMEMQPHPLTNFLRQIWEASLDKIWPNLVNLDKIWVNVDKLGKI